MTATQVGAVQSATGTGSTVAIPVPPSPKVGEVLVAVCVSQIATSPSEFVGPAGGGWTRRGPVFAASSATERIMTVLTKPLTDQATIDALGATVTFTAGAAGTRTEGVMWRMNAIDTVNPVLASTDWSVTLSTLTLPLSEAATVCAFFRVEFSSPQASGVSSITPGTDTQLATVLNPAPENTGVSRSRLTVYAGVEAAGTAAARTIAYAGTGTNPAGFLIAFKTGTGGLAGTTPGASLWTGAVEKPANLTLYTGGVEVPAVRIATKQPDVTVAELMAATPSAPAFIAHRGGSNLYPECTVWAYSQSANAGLRWLELPLWKSSDGIWVVSHDQSTLRTTGVNLDIPSTPWATLAALTVNPTGAAPAQPARPMARLEDVLSLYGNDHGIFAEDKANTDVAGMLNRFEALLPSPQSRVVVKTGGPGASHTATGDLATARGYKSWGYYFLGDTLGTTWQHYTHIGPDYNMDDATITSYVATGKPCIGHVASSGAIASRLLGLGCVALMSSAYAGVATGLKPV